MKVAKVMLRRVRVRKRPMEEKPDESGKEGEDNEDEPSGPTPCGVLGGMLQQEGVNLHPSLRWPERPTHSSGQTRSGKGEGEDQVHKLRKVQGHWQPLGERAVLHPLEVGSQRLRGRLLFMQAIYAAPFQSSGSDRQRYGREDNTPAEQNVSEEGSKDTDPLTKNMDSSLLKAALEQGSFQLFDEDASLQTNAHRKQALPWLRESHQQNS